jgi:hypothetical protein
LNPLVVETFGKGSGRSEQVEYAPCFIIVGFKFILKMVEFALFAVWYWYLKLFEILIAFEALDIVLVKYISRPLL